MWLIFPSCFYDKIDNFYVEFINLNISLIIPILNNIYSKKSWKSNVMFYLFVFIFHTFKIIILHNILIIQIQNYKINSTIILLENE